VARTTSSREEFFRDYSIEEILKTMDGLGVEKAILTTDPNHPQPHVMSFADARPDRFFLGAHLDPRQGMKAIRALESFVRDHNVVLARITPFMIDLPPNHAVYYPVYASVELDLPSRSTPASPDRRSPASASIRCTSTGSACTSRS
jgi:predicted TIM-barrel fold metal-dependent hydrolase